MILPNCRIIWRENDCCDYSGIDSPNCCVSQEHWRNYPHVVHYQYNSRGFRGPEWPSDVANAVWCIGDSFTVGMGSPEQHSWWHLLSQATGRPTINISLDGASNSWISRWVQQVASEFPTSTIVVHWSYTHRRELPLREIEDNIWQGYYSNVKAPDWPDCVSWYEVEHLPTEVQTALRRDPRFHNYTQGFDLESPRRLLETKSTVEQDAVYTQDQIQAACNTTARVINSHIPKWHPEPLNTLCGTWVQEFEQIDQARDGHHYGIKTAELLVSRILQVL